MEYELQDKEGGTLKILVTGLPPWHDMEHLAQYISQNGHEVRHLMVEAPAHYHFSPEEQATDVLERVRREWSPDLWICACPELYPPPRAIENVTIPTVAFISDWNLYQPQLAYNLARFDRVCSDRLGSQVLQLHNAQPEYLQPLYSQRSLVHKPLNLQRDIDILFLGNMNHAIHRNRGAILEKVASLSDTYLVVIDGELPHDEYATLMNRARIVVNYSVRHEMNLRSFETLACGALLFQEANNLEIRDWLVDGEDVVLYSPSSLVPLLEHYLENEVERTTLAASGAAKARNLSAEQRMDTLFNTLADTRYNVRPFVDFDITIRRLAEAYLYAPALPLQQRSLVFPELEALYKSHPHRPETHLALGCYHMDAIKSDQQSDARKSTENHLKSAITHFNEVTRLAPELIIGWLNLALAIRSTKNLKLEYECMLQALSAGDCSHGGLLLGKVTDYYYADWRLSLALGHANANLLHAFAASRLSQLALESGDAKTTLQHAKRAIALHPEVPLPYELAGKAMILDSRWLDAAEILGQGLRFTAFDFTYRKIYLDVLNHLGRNEEASALAKESRRLCKAWRRKSEEAASFTDS